MAGGEEELPTCDSNRDADPLESAEIRTASPGHPAIAFYILIIACTALVMPVFAQEAEYRPLWSATPGTSISDVAMTLDGSTLAAGASNSVYYLDGNGSILWSRDLGYLVKDIAISPEGNYVAAASDKVYFYDRKGSLLWFEKTNFIYHGVAISSNGTYVAAGSEEGKVFVFGPDKEPIWTYTVGSDCYGVDISLDGRFIAVGSKNQNIYLLLNQEGVLWKHGTGQIITAMGMSPTGGIIAGGSADRCLYLLTRGGEYRWKFPTGAAIQGTAVSSGGDFVAASSGNNIYIFNATGAQLWEYDAGAPVGDLAISADGTYLAAVIGGSQSCVRYFTNAPEIDEKDDKNDLSAQGNGKQNPSPSRWQSENGTVNEPALALIRWLDEVFSAIFNRPKGTFA